MGTNYIPFANPNSPTVVFSFEDLFYTRATNTTDLGSNWIRGPAAAPATSDFQVNESSLVAAGKYGAYWNEAGSPPWGSALVAPSIRSTWGNNGRATGVFGGRNGTTPGYIGPVLRWNGTQGYLGSVIASDDGVTAIGAIRRITWNGTAYSHVSLGSTTWYDGSPTPSYVFEIIGSQLKLYDGAGIEKLSVTNTVITSGSQVGIWATRDSGFNILKSVKFEEYA